MTGSTPSLRHTTGWIGGMRVNHYHKPIKVWILRRGLPMWMNLHGWAPAVGSLSVRDVPPKTWEIIPL